MTHDEDIPCPDCDGTGKDEGILYEPSGALQLLTDIKDCPYTIDPATVPKAGIETAPDQVVGTLSVSYNKYKRIQDYFKCLRCNGSGIIPTQVWSSEDAHD